MDQDNLAKKPRLADSESIIAIADTVKLLDNEIIEHALPERTANKASGSFIETMSEDHITRVDDSVSSHCASDQPPPIAYTQLVGACANWYCCHPIDCSLHGTLAIACKNTIVLISAETRKPLGVLVGHKNRVNAVAFTRLKSTPSICVSVSADRSVRLWDTESRSTISKHSAHKNEVNDVCFSHTVPDLVASGDKDGRIVIWRFSSNETTDWMPLANTSVSCLSLHPCIENLIAIGYQGGHILVVDTSNGSIVYRLHGHQDDIQSLSWKPQVGGDTSQSCLASSSRDKSVKIWNVADETVQITLNVPKLNPGMTESQKNRIWVPVVWSANDPNIIYSTGIMGELLEWSINEKSAAYKRFSHGHNRCVFSIVSLGEKSELFTTSLDRQIICWSTKTLKQEFFIPGFGGFVYSLDFCPSDPRKCAIAVGDMTIKIWNTSSRNNPFEMTSIWKGLQSKIVEVSWHPTEDHLLAYGTEDGRIGLVDIYRSKIMPATSYHQGSVQTLDWIVWEENMTMGDSLTPNAEGHQEKSKQKSKKSATEQGHFPGKYSLLSGGGGTILLHNLNQIQNKAQIIWPKLNAGENLKDKSLYRRLVFSVNRQAKLIAISPFVGLMEILTYPEMKSLYSQRLHSKHVNKIRWHPSYLTTVDFQKSDLRVGTCSDDGSVGLHTIQFLQSEEHKISVSSTFASGGMKHLLSFSWSPHEEHVLVACSSDNVAHVWNMQSLVCTSRFRGHSGKVFCAVWSPSDANMIYSGSEDQSVMVWKTNAPWNKADNLMRMASPPINTSVHQIASPVPQAEMNDKYDARKSLPSTQVKAISTHLPNSLGDLNSGTNISSDTLASITTAISSRNSHELITHDVQSTLKRMHEELQTSTESTSIQRFWLGDLTGAFEPVLQQEQLPLLWLALSPALGMSQWRYLCGEYAKELEKRGDFHQASLLWLATNSVRNSVSVLARGGNFEDAFKVASARLDPADPLFPVLFSQWGVHQEKKGNYIIAAECFIKADQKTNAIRCLQLDQSAEALKLALKIGTDHNCLAHIELDEMRKSLVLKLLALARWDEAIDVVESCVTIAIGYYALVLSYKQVTTIPRLQRDQAVSQLEVYLREGDYVSRCLSSFDAWLANRDKDMADDGSWISVVSTQILQQFTKSDSSIHEVLSRGIEELEKIPNDGLKGTVVGHEQCSILLPSCYVFSFCGTPICVFFL
eukprot:TRINITY_DN3271_c0_g1_i2.p1 TRINITY_DN3271_c0_g1~~TRINITY_DN3271_c0_g1_i2.p1  ORF type:complete len:1201 (+),score=169.36 TRINITY_DN3271_c0_g1_i2:60-3662(+)